MTSMETLSNLAARAEEVEGVISTTLVCLTLTNQTTLSSLIHFSLQKVTVTQSRLISRL